MDHSRFFGKEVHSKIGTVNDLQIENRGIYFI